MEFRVGDKVIGNEKTASRYRITIKGWIGTVKEVVDSDNIRVDGPGCHNPCGYEVKSICFDLYSRAKSQKPQKILITSDGATTLARLYEGRKVVKSAESKCSPDDEFNFKEGAKLAFERLMKSELKKSRGWNGKVVCVDDGGSIYHKKGHVYAVKDGILYDNLDEPYDKKVFYSVDEINNFTHFSRFIEFKG